MVKDVLILLMLITSRLVNIPVLVRFAIITIFMLNNVMKRDMKTRREIRQVRADILSCFFLPLVDHPQVHIILTQLIRKLYRLEKRSTWINSVYRRK
jgi:hypothetical protein